MLDAEIVDEVTGIIYRYRIETGFKPAELSAGLLHEAQIKHEEMSVDTGRRAHVMMRRKGGHISVRDDNGRMADYPEQALTSETALFTPGDAGRYPEISTLRHVIGQWRFYHGFRSDAVSPSVPGDHRADAGRGRRQYRRGVRDARPYEARHGGPRPAPYTTPLPGATLAVPKPDEYARFGLTIPEFPQRVFQPRELSDGQIRFLALAAALMSYRRPRFIALNEPEASLHPDMLPALAEMIGKASADSQIRVVTHSYCGSLTQALRWGLPIDVGHGSPWKTGEVFSGSGCSTGIGPFGR